MSSRTFTYCFNHIYECNFDYFSQVPIFYETLTLPTMIFATIDKYSDGLSITWL